MGRELFPSCVRKRLHGLGSTWNSKHVNLLCRLAGAAVLFLISGATPLIRAQTSEPQVSQKLVRGVVILSGHPLAGAIVELCNAEGVELASSVTDDSGEFQIKTDAPPGEYVLLVGEGEQWTDKPIAVNEVDLKMVIAVSALPDRGPQPPGYTVSPQQLKISASVRHHIAAAQIQFNQQNLPGAMREINQALKLNPASSSALTMRAFMHLAAKEMAAAAEDAGQATRIDSSNAEGYLALGTAYNSLKNYRQAEGALRQALALRPNSWQTRLELAKTWYGQKRFVLALRGLQMVDRDFPDVHLVRANILMYLGRAQEGLAEFRTFLEETPQDPRGEQIRRILADHAERPSQP
jgi:tetratricopeptide (TPR) repeat protein